jgi:Bacterial membrane protein YfhO
MPLKIENEDSGSWITSRRFAVFLAILTFVSWPGIFLGSQMFVFRDFGFFSAPIAWHLRESFWQMELPLWNPLSNCGQPFLAEWNTQALYPPALFYLLLPFPWSFGVFCLLHLFLGGLGMFFLARQWTQNSFGAALAGVIFAFSGLMTGSLGWPATIAAMGWMPWVVWLTRRAWREGGKMLVPAALAGALQMLSGGVEMVLLTWVLLGGIFATEFISGGAPRAKIAIRFCIVILFIAGLSAAQLLPFFDLLRHSERAANYFASDSPMPPTGWVNFLVPLFREGFAQGIYYQNGQFWILSYYTGVITVALAAMALWRSRTVEVWVMLILSVFCLLLATGNATPLYGWISAHIGIVGLIRFPVKFVILPVFAMPLMAAYALAGKSQGTLKTSGPDYSWLLAWLATIGLIAVCLVWAAREPSLSLSHAVVVNGLIRVAFFTAIVISLFILRKVTPTTIRRSIQSLVVVLVWLDLECHSPQPPLVKPVVFHPNMPRPAPPPQFGFGRAMIPADVLHTLTFAAHQDATENFLMDRYALFSDCNLFDDIPKCDGFFPLNLRGNSLLNGDPTGRMQDFLGVYQALAIKAGVLGWDPRPTFMPMVTGGQKPLFAADSETLALLAETNFNPRTEVYLPTDIRSAVTVSNAATVKMMSVEYSPQRIRANVDADAPAMLVAAQSYFHPWHAYVDGKPTPLWRANYAFQALEIPAGEHDVELLYVDWNFRIGFLLSLITLAILAVTYWISIVRLKIQSSQFRTWP